MENICLADFTALYKATKGDTYEVSSNEDDNEYDIRNTGNIRKKTLILRFRRYKFNHDPLNYYREQILLFLPWRNELNEI